MKTPPTVDMKKKNKENSPFSFPGERRLDAWFTSDFFKFLLGFSLIILTSFVVLSYFSSPERTDAPMVSDTCVSLGTC